MNIDLENLISNYEENLLNKLRGFGDEEFLKFWVPGTTKLESIYNLIDALMESEIFKVQINNINLNSKEKKSLEKLLNIAIKIIDKKFLELDINKEKYLEFKLKNKKKISNKTFKKIDRISRLDDLILDENINPRYNKILTKIKDLKYNKVKYFDEDLDHFSINFLNNLKFDYFINLKNLKLVYAAHNSNKLYIKSIILDLLCDQIINKSINEIADHGVIYLEHKLRSLLELEKERSYGIYLPRNSGGFFNLIEKNFRECRDKIYQKLSIKDQINKDYFITNDQWSNLSMEDKKNKIEKILKDNVFKKMNIDSSDIILNRIINNNRIEFLLSEKLKGDFQDDKLLEIEDILKNKIDPSIELHSIEEKDINKLRISKAPKAI
jgi:hypothetical protein